MLKEYPARESQQSRLYQAATSLVYLCNQCMRGHHIYIVYACILVPSMFALHPLGVNTCFVRSAMYVVAFNGRLLSNCYTGYTLRWVIHLFAGATAYPYIRDHMVLQSCTSLPLPHTKLFEGGHTPLNLAAWEVALRRHPDKDFAYICSGLWVGFKIGFMRGRRLKSATTNVFSLLEHPDIIQGYVSEQLKLGRMLGPLDPIRHSTVHSNRFGVIPKGHATGKWRLITDLSYPPGESVNNGIDPD